MLPIEKIVGWIKDKPAWWQHSVKLSLSEGALSNKHLDEIYNLALVEHKIISDEEISKLFEGPIDTTGLSDEINEVTLDKIDSVANVGALAGDQTLSFLKNGMTVVYGDNGAGKSSYARIIKHACLSRGGVPEILGNVFEKSDQPSSANISINVDGDVESNEWNLRFKSNSNLKSIRVFDSQAAEHFVTKEDELGYKPSGLHVLEDLAEAVDYVSRRVTEETMPGNGFVSLPSFQDTKTGRFVSHMSRNTVLSEVELYSATDEEIERIELLTKEIDSYRSKSPEQIRKELSNQLRQLTPLKEFVAKSISVVSVKVFSDLKENEQDCLQKKEIADDLKEKTFSGLPVRDIGGDEWRLMWDSAERYIISLDQGGSFPLQENELCPLCLQEIGKFSSEKMAGFVEFLASDAVKIASASKNHLDSKKKNIRDYRFDLTPYAAAITLADEIFDDFRIKILKLFEDLESRKGLFCGEILPEKVTPEETEILEKINKLVSNIEASLASISEDDDSDKIIKRKESDLQELVDKKLFRDNITSIISNIERYKLVAKYENLQEQCKSRPITDKNSEICKQEVVVPLVKAFNSELDKFGFSRFKVSPRTRGKSGAQLMKLEILDGREPLVSKVASEGEQRCISIACFLAEMKADRRKSAVIFDDPVNSLSHQWSHRVAKRLVEESKDRQVVVLTHDIVFYKLLLEEIERVDGPSLNEICLERSRKRAGIVRSTPPWDALTTSKRVKQLQEKVRELRKIGEDGTEREFREASYAFYGYLREAWERLVEEKLLNQVVTRFGRAVQTNRLRRLIDDISQSDFDRVEQGMSRCSTYFRGHDSAPAVGDPFPTIQEIEDDLACLSDFNEELQNKRKRS
ncbi:AAA family ATPase [Halomonas salipaludis]|uniref:ATPase n=1 Tax=Halomonas salipaludis TaxID=2032625 RepID=A0A2A2ENB0_9GAMM|nr:AAA family ATPase [Halomonas salipaludis]PAU74138.1 ATPase [Halomonas salipaludis]